MLGVRTNSSALRDRGPISRPRPNRTLFGIRSMRCAAPSHSIEEHPHRKQASKGEEGPSKQRLLTGLGCRCRSDNPTRARARLLFIFWAPSKSAPWNSPRPPPFYPTTAPQIHSHPSNRRRRQPGSSRACAVAAGVRPTATAKQHAAAARSHGQTKAASGVGARADGTSGPRSSGAGVGAAARCPAPPVPAGERPGGKRRTVSTYIYIALAHTICTPRNPTHGVSRRPSNRQ